ncbi:MAG TPA: hypothetical protein VLE72_02435 [Candidatus Saccharimonadales bacterium]|nr:hypothetical protein [Candidatus Saccharimonadales bacterium]
MAAKLKQPIYDPAKTYDDNFDQGPFWDKVDGIVASQGDPAHRFLGQPIHSRFGIPAGPLLNSNYIKRAFEHGYDVLVYKTQRSRPFGVNEFPNVLFLDVDGDLTLEKAAQPQLGKADTKKAAHEFSITNSFGNPSRGPEYWVDDLKKAISYQGPGQLLLMSVCGTIEGDQSSADYFGDFANAAKLAADAGVSAIELNLSCPNVANEGVICYTPEAVIEIGRRTKELVGNVPLVAKFGYFAPDQQDLLERIIKDSSPYYSAYSVINTIAAPVVDEAGEQALPGPNRLKSGVCGASIRWAGLDMVQRLAALRQKLGLDYEIIGVGGVMNADHFNDYRSAGADVVQSATGAMWNPLLASEIKLDQA